MQLGKGLKSLLQLHFRISAGALRSKDDRRERR